jgi:hypothetical protein
MLKSDPSAIRTGSLAQQRRRDSACTRDHQHLDQRHLLELLEQRVLLSGVTSPVPFVPTTTSLHNIQQGPLAKAGENLANLYLNYRTAAAAGTTAAFEKTTSAASGAGSVDVVGDTVGVELVAVGNLSAFESSMQALGMSIQSTTPADNAIAGFIPIGMISQIAQSSTVLHMTPLIKPTVSQEGEAPDQADQAMNALAARTNYGLTGAGVTVGVVSDSVSQVGGGLSDSVKTGDLPNNVKVIQDGQPGDTDEGRAILEQIYDLAPGASLVFDTCGDSQQSMASAIAALQAAGCNVIIDDIGFDDEPFFQPGVIDAAIDNAVNAGVTYVTAAGNIGDSGFEQAATFVAATDGSGDQLINFNAAGTTPATMMSMTVTQGGGDLTFEWDDAYNGVTGTVTADLEINLYSADGSTLEYTGNSNAFATGVPVQTISNIAKGKYEVQIVAVNTPTADLPGYYEFNIDSDSGTDIGAIQYTGLRTTIVGHAAFSDGISIGAVSFASAPAFSTTTPIPTESFSSEGPAVEARDISGTLLPAAETIDVPELSGTDGNNTSFFGTVTANDPTTFPQFFGTSSAAGNTAGIMALLKQAAPGDTQAQFLAALEATAIPVNGQTAGSYNDIGGFGLIDTEAAIANLDSTGGGGSGGSGGGGSGGGTTGSNAPEATIVAVTPDPRSTSVSSIDIDFTQKVTGFTVADLILSDNGGANLLTDAQTLTTTNHVDFVLTNLTPVTSEDGEYVLDLDASIADIKNLAGVALQNSASTSFEIEAFVDPPFDLSATANGTGTVSLSFGDDADVSSFTLQRDTNSAFTGKVWTTYLPADTFSYTDTGLTPGTVYYYRVSASSSDGTSAYSHAATVITLSTGEVILDNTSTKGVTIDGSWGSSSAVTGYDGVNYLQDNDEGKGEKSVKYRPDLSTAGYYDVYATWTTGSDRATNVPFDIFSKTGVLAETVHVNEASTGGDGWVLLGEFFLHSSTASFVRIRNTGTNGEVIADAIKFLPVDDIERNDGTLTLDTPTATTEAAAVQSPAAVTTESDDNDNLKAYLEAIE